MNVTITENQLLKVIKENIENMASKSEAIYLPEVTPFKFTTWENQGLKAYMYDKQSLELKPIEKYQNIPKFNADKKSWASSHLLILTNDDYNLFNKLTTNVKELIELEEKKIRLLKDHTQALMYERLNKNKTNNPQD
jgi:hypothetical protein